VVLATYCFNNTRLLLLSGIGKPYDPIANTGVVGRNYSYQTGGRVEVFFDDKEFNPFIGGGMVNTSISDFDGDAIDRSELGFIGGAYVAVSSAGATPIKSKPVPHGTPRWGAEWKKAVAHNYRRAFSIGIHGSCQSYRGHYLDLDPTYRDSNGLPRLAPERAENAALHEPEVRGNRQGDEPVELQRARALQQVHHCAVPKHAQHGGCCDGCGPGHQRGQQVPAVVGCAEPVRGWRQRVPAKRRSGPNRDYRHAGMLGGRRYQGDLSQAPRPVDGLGGKRKNLNHGIRGTRGTRGTYGRDPENSFRVFCVFRGYSLKGIPHAHQSCEKALA
jgi:hypothetical protein